MLVSQLLLQKKKTGWEKIALLDCQQMFVKGDLSKCIRLLAYVSLPNEQMPQNPYLGSKKFATRPINPDFFPINRLYSFKFIANALENIQVINISENFKYVQEEIIINLQKKFFLLDFQLFYLGQVLHFSSPIFGIIQGSWNTNGILSLDIKDLNIINPLLIK